LEGGCGRVVVPQDSSQGMKHLARKVPRHIEKHFINLPQLTCHPCKLGDFVL
jgi:hypothetical protein